MIVSVDDAPFTAEQKRKIKRMGFVGVYWREGLADDPVAYFREVHRLRGSFKAASRADFKHGRGPLGFNTVRKQPSR